jgi:transposase
MSYVVWMEIEPPTTECARCKLLEAEVVSLKAMVESLAKTVKELTKKLEEATRSKKRQAAPFRKSNSQKKPKDLHRKSGRIAGHPVASKPIPERVDRIIDVPVNQCPDCNVDLKDIRVEEQFQTEIPEIKPVITKFVIGIGTCPCCGNRVQASHPEQTSQALGAANHSMGPNAIGIASQLKYQLGMPFRKITNFFSSTFNLDFSPGGIVRATQSLAGKATGLVSALRMQLPTQKVVHVDETGWWVGGDRKYLHVFCTKNIVLFKVGDRSNETAIEVLGKCFSNTLCCDGYAGYDLFETARCNAHPLRRVRDLMEAMPKKYSDLQRIHDLLAYGMHLSKTRQDMPPSNYAKLVREHETALGDWIESHLDDKRTEAARLAKHLNKYRVEFSKHLFDPEIPSTNNYAERTLRGAVLLRKVGCCNRTEAGVKAFEILSSLWATFEKRRMHFTEWIKDRLTGLGPKYVPVDLLPANFPYKIQLNC